MGRPGASAVSPRSTACTIALSTGERHERPTLARAEILLRDLLTAAPPGTTAEVRQGTRRMTYSLGARGGVCRGALRRPVGRPELAPEKRRAGVFVRLAPGIVATLDAIASEDDVSRGVEIDRLVESEARRRGRSDRAAGS